MHANSKNSYFPFFPPMLFLPEIFNSDASPWDINLRRCFFFLTIFILCVYIFSLWFLIVFRRKRIIFGPPYCRVTLFSNGFYERYCWTTLIRGKINSCNPQKTTINPQQRRAGQSPDLYIIFYMFSQSVWYIIYIWSNIYIYIARDRINQQWWDVQRFGRLASLGIMGNQFRVPLKLFEPSKTIAISCLRGALN